MREIARHVYNRHYGLFAQDVMFERIYSQIRNYLWKQSRQRHSSFIRLEHGQYAIRQDVGAQLDFISELYKEEKEEEGLIPHLDDDSRQLSLF